METQSPIRWPGSDRWEAVPFRSAIDRLLAKLRSPVALVSRFRYDRDMVSPEQVGNFEVLLAMVLARKVPGEIVELGCFTGSTAVVIGTILERHGAGRKFHVHDRFDIDPQGRKDIEDRFRANMAAYHVNMPVVHKGDLVHTVPSQLPEHIVFAHLDCGFGGDMHVHAALVEHCLAGLYSRMAPGAVLVIMDYHVPGITRQGFNANPGSRIGADRFFADKPETIVPLNGGACSHAYVLKE